MICPACGLPADPSHRYCARCNTDLYPAQPVSSYELWPATEPVSPEPAYPYPHPPHHLPPPPMPGLRGAWLLALMVDGLFGAFVLLCGLALATVIARGRGADGLNAVLHRLGWLHLFLALVVLGIYRLGAFWLGGRTLGRIWTDRLGGRQFPDARSPVPMLIPTLVTTAVLGVIVGSTVPVSARTDRTGSPAVPSPSASSPAGKASGGTAGGDAPRRSDAAAQARALNEVLDASTNSRASLRDALAAADSCDTSGRAVTTVRRVADERQAQLSQARTLVVDALPTGTQIRDQLVAALQHSVAADQAFAAWAQNVANGHCGHDSNYATAQSESSAAQAAKQRFCQTWNPVAVAAGLPARTEDQV
jgi:hypothetical protein